MDKKNTEMAQSLKELEKEVKELREMVNFLVGYLMSINNLEEEDLSPQVMDVDSLVKNNRYSM